MPVFLVEEQDNDMESVYNKLIAKGGMLSSKQVHRIKFDELSADQITASALVVIHYTYPGSESGTNAVLTKVLGIIPPSSQTPILVYSPSPGAVTKTDMGTLAERQAVLSNFPFRLMSDIWAAMCILPINPGRSPIEIIRDEIKRLVG